MTSFNKGTFIVVPAFNEAATISEVVRRAKVFGEVIVVNDASTDLTSELARDAGAGLVDLPINQGYARALIAGIESLPTGAEIVVCLDADAEIAPELIPSALQALCEGNFLIGNRLKKPRLFESLLSKMVCGETGIKDLFSGFLIIRRPKDFFPLPTTIDSAATILKLHFVLQGHGVVNFPFDQGRRSGRSRFGNHLSANLKLLFSAYLFWKAKKLSDKL